MYNYVNTTVNVMTFIYTSVFGFSLNKKEIVDHLTTLQ